MANLTERKKALHAWMLANSKRISKCLHETMTEFRLLGTDGYPGNVHQLSLERLKEAGWVRCCTESDLGLPWLVYEAVEVADV